MPESPLDRPALPRRPVELLLVEDNLGDVRLAEEALKQVEAPHRLTVVRDGEAAVELLAKAGADCTAFVPDLILLDLNLPRKDGRQLLEEIKADPRLRRIPVIIMTTSSNEDDVMTAYDLNANAFVRKPLSVGNFLELIRAIEAFWLRSAVLPTFRARPRQTASERSSNTRRTGQVRT